MGTLTGTDATAQGGVVNGVTLGDPATDEDGNFVWDHGSIPDGDVMPVPVVVKDGTTSVDSKWVPPKDYKVSAERAENPVAVKPRLAAVSADVDPIEEPKDEEPVEESLP